MTAEPAGSSGFTLTVAFELLLLPVELASLSVPDADPLASPVASAGSESPDGVTPAVFRLPAFAGSSDADAAAVGAGEDAEGSESCLTTRASRSGSHSGQAYAETTGARERRAVVKCAAFILAVVVVVGGGEGVVVGHSKAARNQVTDALNQGGPRSESGSDISIPPEIPVENWMWWRLIVNRLWNGKRRVWCVLV